MSRLRRLRARPAGETQAVPEPSREVEDLESPAIAELVELQAHRVFECVEVELDFRSGEEIVGPVPPVRDQFEGHLVLEHEGVGGKPEARFFFGQCIELADAFGRKREEKPVAQDIGEKRVSESPAFSLQEPGRISEQRRAGAQPGESARGRGSGCDAGKRRHGPSIFGFMPHGFLPTQSASGRSSRGSGSAAPGCA